ALSSQNTTYRPRRNIELSKELTQKPRETEQTAQKATVVQLSVGDRVKHITFGEGTLLSAKPMGADTLYEIAFDKVGTKKLMATYAKLKKI
ncbi:MAG: ATP-dependent DNA helicase PcrA, partial [Clostridia bacterium]|nr:ATP-dependent DNA helicase PcrA [Clostridia bacterium]